MIIGIDTRVPTKNKTGVGYLLDNIIPLMVAKDNANYYKLIGSGFGINKKNVKVLTLPRIIQRGFNFLWKNIFFPPVNLLIGKTDIFFFTNFTILPAKARKKILLVPDMSFRKFPQFTEKKNLLFLNKHVGGSIKSADKIITISESAKKEICDYYKTSSQKVEVVYLGCPKNIKKIENQDLIEKTKNRYGISGKYILFVGTLEPRKNLGRLIEAYNSLSDELKQEYRLVLCGGKGWYYNEIFDIVEKHQLGDRVVFTGYADENDMAAVYTGASLFAFASLYEGFGIPILEAFICGVPVVCSNASSLPEVAGEAAQYCDPNDSASIGQSIEKVLQSNHLRAELIKKGHDQLKKFSWEQSAEKILKILLED